MTASQRKNADLSLWLSKALIALLVALGTNTLWAQVDQGAIACVAKDTSGAVIPNAELTLTETGTGLVLHGHTNQAGLYSFSPLKIGNYEVTATASGFEATRQQNIYVHALERVSVNLTLTAGGANETVVVSSAPPLLETESSTVGQVIDTDAISNVPLNGRNWVYIAQLAAGVTPSTGMSNGSGTGDFFANGQRASQNNFILNGVDNNAIVDGAGTSFTQEPPPDALSEFSVSTTNYNAEYGFSAGAVVNASIKSGTNAIHGSLWEYLRNTVFDAVDWENPPHTPVPPYHENQFGVTFGAPILHNKLFYFGDAQANLISYSNTSTGTVPTALMRQGDFSELLNTSLNGQAQPVQLYAPNSGGAQTLSCNGKNNVLCPNLVDPVAQTLINLYPLPNVNNGATYNNYIATQPTSSHTWQWDNRLDWNVSEKDRAFAILSYNNNVYTEAPYLGYILDGGSGVNNQRAESAVLSETHVFTPTLTNEFRFSYNWAQYSFLSINANVDVAAKYGVSMPFGHDYPENGGLPDTRPSAGPVDNINGFGTSDYEPNIQRQNELQIQDNVIKVLGAHTLKTGVDLQPIRIYLDQPPHGRGTYYYKGVYTGNPNSSSPSGFGLADFYTNNMTLAYVSPNIPIDYYRWYRAGYLQDDWRVSNKLTLNLGLRYDYFSPISQQNYAISNIVCNSCSGIGTGSATLLVPSALRSTYSALPQSYFNLLAQSNVTIQYQDSHSLSSTPTDNLAPRIGFSYGVTPKTVLNGGFGIFYGGAEAFSGLELSLNYPYEFTNTYQQTQSCLPNNCPSIGTTYEQGFFGANGNGLLNAVSFPTYNGVDVNQKTPYTESYNLAVQRELTPDMTATVSYVGNESRHLGTLLSPNNSNALQNPANSGQSATPFPLLGNFNLVSTSGFSRYDSFQGKVEQRFAGGLSFLATYTWSHALDDSVSPSGIEAGTQDRNTNLIPIRYEYTNSAFDVRHRLTLNTYYELPFGLHKKYLKQRSVAEELAGGWAADVTFAAQTGVPFSVGPDISTASQSGATNTYAIRVGDPFKGGGSPDPSNPGVTCPAHVKNRTNWYNPCAFANPLSGTNIPQSGPGSLVTGLANAIAYLGGPPNQIHGPGYARVSMSLFKSFPVWREQALQFRADIFNVTNTPSLGNPGNTNNGPSAGQITGPRFFQNLTPDSRFLQLALKYSF